MQLSKSEHIRRALRATKVIRYGTLAEIAKKYGTSRELVRQALKHPTVNKSVYVYKRWCDVCAKRLNTLSTREENLCRKCWGVRRWFNIRCDFCDKKFWRVKSQYILTPYHYCSRSCRSKDIVRIKHA
jgi:hypothetical protein